MLRRSISRAGCLRLLLAGVSAVLAVLFFWVWRTNAQISTTETLAPAAVAEGQFVNVGGYALHVERFGPADGVPVLLLHGFGPVGGLDFRVIAPLLAAERPLIIPDMLGFGFSERVTEPVADYTHVGQAQLMFGLLDTLGVAQVDVVGASYGGGIAAEMALAAPERIRSIVFLDAQVYDIGGGFFAALGNLPLGIGRALTYTALGGGQVSESMFTAGCEEPGGFCPDATWRQARAHRVAVVDTTSALRAFSRTAPAATIPEALPAIGQPALVIWGSADTIIDPARGVELAETLPQARLIMLEGLGHSPHNEDPVRVAAEMLAFWASAES